MFGNNGFYPSNYSYNNFLFGFNFKPFPAMFGLNNTNFKLYQPFFNIQKTYPVAANNQPYANQNFNEFCAKAYEGIPDRTTTSADKEKAILAKISILNHPQCPPQLKSVLLGEISTINGELRAIDKETTGTNNDFEAFAKRMYNGIPDRTTNVNDKQKAILAKVAIMNHPQCPEASKAELMNEISTINSEIMQIKSNCNKKI